MKPIIHDQAEKLRQLADRESTDTETSVAVSIDPPGVETDFVEPASLEEKPEPTPINPEPNGKRNGKRRLRKNGNKSIGIKQPPDTNHISRPVPEPPKTPDTAQKINDIKSGTGIKITAEKKSGPPPARPSTITSLIAAKRIPVNDATQIIAITGGKGGVGKSNIASNLAIAIAQMKKRVLLLDADLSLANVDVLFGLTPRLNLSHVISGEKTLDEIVIQGPEGITIVPGGSGLEQLTHLGDEEMDRLFDAFSGIDPAPDYMLIDTAAGIHSNVLQFLMAADQTIVVTTPEPTAYTDAYALIKTCVRRDATRTLGVLVNMAQDGREATDVTRLMLNMCRQFLDVSFNNLGFVPRDKDVLKAVRHQKPFLLGSPACPASKAVRHIAATILQIEIRDVKQRGLGKFLQRLFTNRPVKQAEAS